MSDESPAIDLSVGVDPARLEAAVAWAEGAYRRCDVCRERCGVDRLAGELGRCGLGPEGRVYKEYVHLGEEQPLVPSHTVFLAGCNFRCVFCSDHGPVRQPRDHGVLLSPAELAQRISLRRKQGARNVNFVGGLPDVNVFYILRTLERCPADTHVVWNTNLWTTVEALERLGGVVGTFLADFKFGNDRCAFDLAGVEGYRAAMEELLPLAARSAHLLVRHLVMPGHLDCCTRPVLRWLAARRPQPLVNLMTGYRPFLASRRSDELRRPLEAHEREAAVACLDELGLNALLDGRLL